MDNNISKRGFPTLSKRIRELLDLARLPVCAVALIERARDALKTLTFSRRDARARCSTAHVRISPSLPRPPSVKSNLQLSRVAGLSAPTLSFRDYIVR